MLSSFHAIQDGLRVLGLEAEPSSGLVLEDSPSGIKDSRLTELHFLCASKVGCQPNLSQWAARAG
eukprot:scaffold44270_cov18-Tisochrysis_lutea.AAC.1